MAKYRDALPLLDDDIFLTDGGLETTLIFHEGVELPEFAAFVLLEDDDGRERLRAYFRRYMAVARDAGTGFVAEAATWRANPDWAARLGYDADGLARINQAAIELLVGLRDEFEAGDDPAPFVISGCIGPRDDGYNPSAHMTADEARQYHQQQIDVFAGTDADMVLAMTMTHTGEAIGVVQAAQRAGIPVAIAFTVETDGHLPSGMPLGEAIVDVDAATGGGPVYYMINCAHPSHFEAQLDPDEDWVRRIRAVRANASTRSHAELDEAEELDAGDPEALGRDYARLRSTFDQITVLGGCCGTDDRHIAAISAACVTTG